MHGGDDGYDSYDNKYSGDGSNGDDCYENDDTGDDGNGDVSDCSVVIMNLMVMMVVIMLAIY